jgi:mannose-6-phosphate isomerase-like protein (cupin superfamily)
MLTQPPKPYREKRPWGEFVKFEENSPCTVKIITVNRGQEFSLQSHKSRDEFWHILAGEGTATIGDKRTEIVKGEEYFVPRETLHRILAGNSDVVILEISYGVFDEGDITRVKDDYGRIK